jgi:hypothetical protein
MHDDINDSVNELFAGHALRADMEPIDKHSTFQINDDSFSKMPIENKNIDIDSSPIQNDPNRGSSIGASNRRRTKGPYNEE